MTITIRNDVKVLLINSEKKLLLLKCDHKVATHPAFWVPIGGGIADDEKIEQAALREIEGKTGLTEEKVQLGPVVWHGSIQMSRAGVETRCNQQFIVATTDQTVVTLDKLTPEEKAVITTVRWFSLDDITSTDEILCPVILAQHIADVFARRYPEQPIEIDLARKS